MKYQWTDWITHVPGQELLPGTYGLFEFHGLNRNGGEPYAVEGAITSAHRKHGSWYATTPGENEWCMIIRYKLRSIAEESEQSAERELENANG